MLKAFSGSWPKRCATPSATARADLAATELALPLPSDQRRRPGFSVDGPETRTGGFGPTSMRERAEDGAEYAITSAPGEGTTVRVTWE